MRYKYSTLLDKVKFGCLFVIITLNLNCEKLIEIDPPITAVTETNVYRSDATAIAVLTGLYTQLSSSDMLSTDYAVNNISLWAGLSSDELTLWDGVNSVPLNSYYKNNLSVNNGSNGFWFSAYNNIFTCNSAIAALTNEKLSQLTPAVKEQLLGEALFIRAFTYFYLVNFFGDVPLALSADYRINSSLPRSTKDKVYQQIIQDLKEAQNNLNDQYVDGTLQKITEQRVRPNKWAATALLARTFLYTGDWENAEIQSTAVINNSSLYGLNILNDVFLKNSTEAVWQLQPVLNGPTNTSDGYHFIVPSSGPNEPVNPVYLSQRLLNSFEGKDKRRTDWIDSVTVDGTTYYYPFKYKVSGINDDVSEYQMILRLGEQYIIRAEARAEQGKVIDAEADLNIIRARAGLKNTTAISQSELINAIQHERQVELFAELGHRWLDLKRTGRINGVMTLVTQQKGGIWNTNQQLHPIPLTEIQKDPNLVQNDGY